MKSVVVFLTQGKAGVAALVDGTEGGAPRVLARLYLQEPPRAGAG